MNKHTGLTFRILENGGKGSLVGVGVSNSDWFFAEECTKANAAFIVKACNNHYKLLLTLTEAQNLIEAENNTVDTESLIWLIRQVIKDAS